MSDKIQDFKNAFSHQKIHLNNAGLAPISRPARDKILYWGNRFYEEGFYTDQDYMNDVLFSRQKLAELIGTTKEEIAFFQSTASAVSQVCFHYPLEKNDEVIMWDQEYASHLYPWQEACKRSGAKLVLVSSEDNLNTPYERILSAVTEKTKVVAISWVQFQTGAITNLEKLGSELKKRNIFFMVDAIQGLGIFPMKMKEWGISAVVGGSHKWLVSPVGVGFLALDMTYIPKIKPHNVGAYTFGTCDDPTDLFCEPKRDALKFEAGSKQVLEITALGASINFILETGVEKIECEVLRLAKLLRLELEQKGFIIHSPYSLENHRSSIVNFQKPGLENKQLALKLPCLYALRGPGVRLSAHAFNTDEEIRQVISSLSV